jgi:CDP-diacylglycerol--glycerol-3-phosphate 3-phosphatidyltransferase
MIENLKPFYNDVLRPVGRLLARAQVKPNHVTAAGVVLFCLAGWLAAIGYWKFSAMAVVAGACMDGLDGLVAREFGGTSVFGAIFDSVCDRITEIVWIGGIAFYYLRHGTDTGVILAFAALSCSMMVSYVKARAEGAGIPCHGGILQRPERIIVVGAGLLIGPTAMLWGLGIVTAASLVTVVQRMAGIVRQCNRADAS